MQSCEIAARYVFEYLTTELEDYHFDHEDVVVSPFLSVGTYAPVDKKS